MRATIGVLILSLLPGDSWSQSTSSYPSDPVALAQHVIRQSYPWWTSLGYGTKRAQYTIGWMAAPGVGYVLLGWPALGIAAASGGAVGLSIEVGSQLLITLSKEALETPDVASRKIATAHRNRALDDYAAAYAIARRWIDTKSMSEGDARKFLELRWSVLRLEAAAILFKAAIDRGSAGLQLATAEAKAAITDLVERYQLEVLALDKALPVAEAAMFIKELRQALEAHAAGLAVYAPFVRFSQTLAEIDAQRVREASAFAPIAVLPSDCAAPPGKGSFVELAALDEPMCAVMELDSGARRLLRFAPLGVTVTPAAADGQAAVAVAKHGTRSDDQVLPGVLTIAQAVDGRWKVSFIQTYVPDDEGDNHVALVDAFIARQGALLVAVVTTEPGWSSDRDSRLFVLQGDGGDPVPVPYDVPDAAALERLGLGPVSSSDRLIYSGIEGDDLGLRVAVLRPADTRPCAAAGEYSIPHRVKRAARGYSLVPAGGPERRPCSRR